MAQVTQFSTGKPPTSSISCCSKNAPKPAAPAITTSALFHHAFPGNFYRSIFDEATASAKGIKVKNYLSLDNDSGVVLYQGFFDKKSGTVEIDGKGAA